MFQAVDANHDNVVIADLDSGVGVVPVARDAVPTFSPRTMPEADMRTARKAATGCG